MTNYAQEFAIALEDKFNDPAGEQRKRFPHFVYEIEVEPGKKFDRIVISFSTGREEANGRRPQRSVHAFVEKATGRLCKSAGWRAPAKRSNGDLQSKYNLTTDMALAVHDADPYGGYLYIR
jgi:hypothetical protein